MEENKTTMKEIYDTLSQVDCSEYLEKRSAGGGRTLTYLSWASAWDLLMQYYPDSTYVVHEDSPNRQCIYDDELGYMVKTSLTVEGHTRSMTLPVMDNNFKIMYDHPYTYVVKGETRTVDKATMFDINASVMRCLVKNIALFGLGLYVYRGEDLPAEAAKEFKKVKSEMVKKITPELNAAKTVEEVGAIKAKYEEFISKDSELRQLFIDKMRSFNPFG